MAVGKGRSDSRVLREKGQQVLNTSKDEEMADEGQGLAPVKPVSPLAELIKTGQRLADGPVHDPLHRLPIGGLNGRPFLPRAAQGPLQPVLRLRVGPGAASRARHCATRRRAPSRWS